MREPGASPGRSRRCEGRRPTWKRHWPQGREGREGGAPSQKTCRAPQPRTPRGRRIRASQAHCTLACCSFVLHVPAAALAANVKIRVEGKTTTIFGASQPTVTADNALQALDVASIAGEFYYGTTTTEFGDYVSQIGKYPAGGSAGWVFKVNGVSPPVGADKVDAEGRRRRALVLRNVRAGRRAADARAEAAAGQLLRRRVGHRRRQAHPGSDRDAHRGREAVPGARPAVPASASTSGSSGRPHRVPSARTR